ncbi:hypothetical protein RLEG12_01065 (plasmid) [Rhizobium leguminosarum bv. trifolii CB782]|nr:hypothetical protein RLEG12_01065 [Rhizobium leguminosarum bv. trifolii CB782]
MMAAFFLLQFQEESRAQSRLDPGDTKPRSGMKKGTTLMSHDSNPFSSSDQDRHEIWEMLVRKDVDGFVNEDWSDFGRSFKNNGFCGLDAKGSLNPADWQVRFPTVEAYRDAWLEDASRSAATAYAEDRREALFRATNMLDIRVEGYTATARKTFDDAIALQGGGSQKLNWQSVFFCTKDADGWKITGFVGFLPFESA